jgi:K+-sensing histidine kinase KdpD
LILINWAQSSSRIRKMSGQNRVTPASKRYVTDWESHTPSMIRAARVSLNSELEGVKVVNNCQGLTARADSVLKQLFSNLIENSLKHGKNVSQIKI